MISNDKLGQEFAQVLGEKRACLMRGHGITTAGRSVQEATLTAIRLNELAEMNYRAPLLGNPQPIAVEEIEAIVGSGGKARLMVHADSAWRYYCNLLDK